ncbi:MAG: DUF1365 domain-containing protein [Burkholderiaceae bacterium]|jgi:DUF1365 family protein|nr:DUF1365 domain-containing protein [Burkholderiaceae bacterium]MCO5104647.1 DUF1365 domain-containing protein [Burkholderiaceae bacterium]
MTAAAACARPGVTEVPARPLIGFGQVRHARLRPKEHRFSYATFFLLLPMRTLARGADAGALAVNRRGAISFHDADHGDGRPASSGGALAWLDALLRAEGIHDATGQVWLHCYPRVLGYTFKPVSFWYCERADGSLRAIVVEVNNTFGERHCYLLDEPAWSQELQAEKVFHVSPFCDVSGSYRFRFLFTDKGGVLRTVARIDHDDAHGALIETSVSGALEPATRAALRRALWRYPVMTLAVIVRIHWQALRLWTLRVGFRSKPPSPAAPISHQQHPQHRDARRQP